METINLRQVSDRDRNFLWNLKVKTMRKCIESVYGWDESQQLSFFNADFTPQRLRIIQYNRRDIGMYELQERDAERYLAQIQILPEYQGRGIGSSVISKVIKDSRSRNMPLRLQVFKINPAIRMYRRLGFMETGQSDFHVQMELSN